MVNKNDSYMNVASSEMSNLGGDLHCSVCCYVVLYRMVDNRDMPLSADEPKNMIDVTFDQESNSNKKSMSVILCEFCDH